MDEDRWLFVHHKEKRIWKFPFETSIFSPPLAIQNLCNLRQYFNCRNRNSCSFSYLICTALTQQLQKTLTSSYSSQQTLILQIQLKFQVIERIPINKMETCSHLNRQTVFIMTKMLWQGREQWLKNRPPHERMEIKSQTHPKASIRLTSCFKNENK